MNTTIESGTADDLKCHAATLRLHGLVAHFDELTEQQLPWLQTVGCCGQAQGVYVSLSQRNRVRSSPRIVRKSPSRTAVLGGFFFLWA